MILNSENSTCVRDCRGCVKGSTLGLGEGTVTTSEFLKPHESNFKVRRSVRSELLNKFHWGSQNCPKSVLFHGHRYVDTCRQFVVIRVAREWDI